MMLQFLEAFWQITLDTSFWLLVGFLLAGVIHVTLRPELVRKLLNEPGSTSVFKAAALGVPLPLCSCSVIPVATALRRSGASSGATASFLIGTPEIGIDSFLLSYGLLGLPLAILRAVAAFISSIVAGLSIDTIDRWSNRLPATQQPAEVSPCGSCCHASRDSKQGVVDPSDKVSLLSKDGIARVLHYGFIVVMGDLAGVLFVGLTLAAVVTAYLPPSIFESLQLSTLVSGLVVLLVSLPLYVCATASTPLAAALVEKGLDPGAAVLFLLAGPATNVTTMLFVYRELGGRSLALYLASITAVAVIAAWLANTFAIFQLSAANRPAGSIHHIDTAEHHHLLPLPHDLSLVPEVAAIVFLGLLLAHLAPRVFNSAKTAQSA